MARGYPRASTEVAGLTVRSVENEPVRANISGYFRDNPKGSLKELFSKNDRLSLYDKGKEIPVVVSAVKDRSVVVRFPLATATRLVLEKDAEGNVIGLKESGVNGRRVVSKA